MAGRLIAFEGLDQSGKQTQAEWLAEALRAAGHRVQTLSFPDYQTTIGAEIGAALQGRRDYGPDVLQLLYVANRYEHAPRDPRLAGRRADGRRRSLSRPRAWPTARRRGSTSTG